jgi:hypothetical protein
MCLGSEAQAGTDPIAQCIDPFFSKLFDPAALHADEMIMIRHTAGELKMRTSSLETVLHQNSAGR